MAMHSINSYNITDINPIKGLYIFEDTESEVLVSLDVNAFGLRGAGVRFAVETCFACSEHFNVLKGTDPVTIAEKHLGTILYVFDKHKGMYINTRDWAETYGFDYQEYKPYRGSSESLPLCHKCHDEYLKHDDCYGDIIDDFMVSEYKDARGYSYYTNAEGAKFCVCADCGLFIPKLSERKRVGSQFKQKTVCEHCHKEHAHCHMCGKPLTKDEIVWDEAGHPWCNDCVENEWEECTECGSLHPKEYMVHDTNNNWYCDEDRCMSVLANCSICGDYICKEESFYDEHREEYVCDYCVHHHYHVCYHCGEELHEDEMTEVHSGHWVCNEYCLDENYTQCAECHEWFPAENVTYYESREESYCADCYPHEEVLRKYHGGIGDHGDYNLLWMNDEGKRHSRDNEDERYDQLHISPEIEIEDGGTDEDNALYIVGEERINDTIVCTKDCSLNDGFELVPCVATYKAHVNHMGWEDIFERALEKGYTAHDGGNCGLHVHFDRFYFQEYGSWGEVEAAFAKIFAANLDWIMKFSRRENFYYCKTREAEHYLDGTDTLEDYIANCSGHYTALNLGNSGTIEIRIMRGTLRYSTFKATLQFMQMFGIGAVVDYLEGGWVWTLDDFIAAASKNEYQEFLDYCQCKGLTQASKLNIQRCNFAEEN